MDSNGHGPFADHYKRLMDIGLVLLSEEHDLDSLLQKVLDFSLDFTSSDAGSLYLVRGNELEFVAWRNRSLEAHDQSQPFGNLRVPINDRTLCGYVAGTGHHLNIPNVAQLHPSLPYHFNSSFDELFSYKTESMLALPLTIRGGQVVGVLQLINHIEDGKVKSFPEDMMAPIQVLTRQAGMALHNAMLTENIRQSQLETVNRLAMAAETRDNDTGKHLKRVAIYSRILASTLGKGEEFAELMFNAAPLHDVGKIGLPDCILKKAGRFTDEERHVMQEHSQLGHDLLVGSKSPLLQMGARIALAHHEKWNGSGYPHGLRASEIPLEGRLMAVVDVFDALSCKRCYKEAWEMDKVVDTVRSERGQHFDPDLIDRFVEVIPKFVDVYQKYRD